MTQLELNAIEQCGKLLIDETFVYDDVECVVLSDAERCYIQGYKDAIENACEWLKNYRQDTPDGLGYIAGIVNDKTIEDFRKIMYG